MQGISRISALVGVALLTAATTAHGERTAESTTLFVCQRQAGAQASRYAFVRARLLSACLTRAAADVVLANEGTSDLSVAATRCIRLLYALGRTDGRSPGDRMEQRINRFCDPDEDFPAHGEDDILGTGTPQVNQPLGVGALDGWCGGLAGGAGTLEEWIDCLRAAAECSAHQQIAAELPRALEWLNRIDTELASSTHPLAAQARAELQAIEEAIDGASDDDVPDITCGPAALASCGNDTLESPEQCDGSDLGGSDCTDLGFDGGTLACTGTCSFDVSGCSCTSPTGDATVADVLAGKTFSNTGGIGLTGAMPDNGAVTLTPTTSDQSIAAGFHDGSGVCEGDADLVSSNIRSGVDLFGVAGDPKAGKSEQPASGSQRV